MKDQRGLSLEECAVLEAAARALGKATHRGAFDEKMFRAMAAEELRELKEELDRG